LIFHFEGASEGLQLMQMTGNLLFLVAAAFALIATASQVDPLSEYRPGGNMSRHFIENWTGSD
jgi:hypothetical protein